MIAHFLIFLLPFLSQATDIDITGTGEIHKVIQYGRDVTPQHNPYRERYLILRKDNTFESDGRPYGRKRGNYEFNTSDHILFMDSDAGPEDDSKRLVTMWRDTMYWKGIGNEWGESFGMIQVRKE